MDKMIYDYIIREHKEEHGNAEEVRCFQFSDGKGNALACRGRVKFADGHKECPQHVIKKGRFKPGAVTSVYLAGAESFEPLAKERARELWENFYSAGLVFLTEGESCAEDVNKALNSIQDYAVAAFQTHDNDGWEEEFKRLARKTDRKIVIFADNDEKGLEFARKRAQQTHEAGFDDVFVIPMTQRPDGSDSPDDGYDIGDWLKEGGNIIALIDDAPPYDAIAERVKECAAKQIKPREDDDINAIEDEDFPINGLGAIEDFALEAKRQIKTPLSTNTGVAIGIFGGFVGGYKATCEGVTPTLGDVIVGESATGKSQLIKLAKHRVVNIQREEKESRRLDEWDREDEEERRKLAKSRRRALKNEGKPYDKQDAIIKETTAKLADSLTYQTQFRSAKGVIKLLNLNRKAARERGITPNGTILLVDDACELFNSSGGGKHMAENQAIINAILDYEEYNAMILGDQCEKFEFDRVSGACVAAIQPGLCRAVDNDDTRDQGNLVRYLWTRTLYQKECIEKPDCKSPALESYYKLFDKALLFRGGEFELDNAAKEVYASWAPKNKGRANKALAEADKTRNAFINKMQKTSLQIALILHLAKCFERAEIIEENGTKRLGEIKTAIDAETMKAATRLVDAFIGCRNIVWKQIEKAVRKPQNATTTGLSPDAETVKDKLAEGELIDRYDVDGATYEARRSTISAVAHGRNAYRKNNERRARIDKELIDAGEMFIDREELIAVIRMEEEWHD